MEEWRSRLGEIPSRFGRLVYISALLDRTTIRYEAELLAGILGVEASYAGIRQAQREFFSEWLNLTLEQQAADLDLYLSLTGVCKPAVLQSWIRFTPFRYLIPAEADEAERQLFVCDLERIIASLASRYEAPRVVASPVVPRFAA